MDLQVLGSCRELLCISHADDFALLEELSEEECGHLIGQQPQCLRSVELLFHHAKCYLVLLDRKTEGLLLQLLTLFLSV